MYCQRFEHLYSNLVRGQQKQVVIMRQHRKAGVGMGELVED